MTSELKIKHIALCTLEKPKYFWLGKRLKNNNFNRAKTKTGKGRKRKPKI